MTTPEPPPPTLPDDVQKAWRELHGRFMELLLQVTVSFVEQKPTAPKYAQEMVRWTKEYDLITAALARIPELETQLATEREKVARLESELADYNGVEKLMAAIPEAKEE